MRRPPSADQGDAASASGSLHNPYVHLPDSTVEALRQLRAEYLESLRADEDAIRVATTPRAEERALREDTVAAIRRVIPDWSQRTERVRPIADARIDRVRGVRTRRYLDHLTHTVPVRDRHETPPDGMFWWGDTQWNWTPGMGVADLTDGLHFFGTVNYNADPLFITNAGAVAHFWLDAARRPTTMSGAYLSAPVIGLAGVVSGWTKFAAGLFGTDDVWCKCWLHLRQTALQFTALPTVLASRTDVQTLIFTEDEMQFRASPLPGFASMPLIQFGLADPGLPIMIELEVRFALQLEGASGVSFSPENNPSQSVVLNLPQWRIQPI